MASPGSSSGSWSATTSGTDAIEPTFLTSTRAAYDAVAESYAEQLADLLDTMPLDRALLGLFAELVKAGDPGPVGDLGCGPGRLTGHLAGLGLDVFGVDLSPRMVAVARERHPHLRFEVGTLTALDLPDRGLAAAVAWYSLIHTPPGALPDVVSELARVVRPGGELVLAFQAGDDDHVHHEQGYGHEIDLDGYRLSTESMVRVLAAAGFTVHTRVLREPEGREKTDQAFLLARRVGAPV